MNKNFLKNEIRIYSEPNMYNLDLGTGIQAALNGMFYYGKC
jgi:hypothetical protein